MMRRRAMAARAAGALARGGARAAGSSAAAAAASSSSSNEVRASPRHVSRCNRRRRGLHRRHLSSLPAASSSNTTTLPQQRPDNEDADLDAYAPAHPIDFPSASQITGEESQILEVRLEPHQTLRAESGAMLYMTRGVTMETSMGLGGTTAATGGADGPRG